MHRGNKPKATGNPAVAKTVSVMDRSEMAKGLLDEIERTRAQLARLHAGLMMRVDERASGMEYEECQHLWKACQESHD
jgi:hypothetical protein